ncbi:MAG: universal stress protein [Pirellula sp.]|jgi:nucleotide-binding universal stress UspA family protein|nr:universal stress protein [Pirellula sp.]
MKVLVASDGSPASLDAVNEYCRLSASNPHEITILTVDDVQPYGVLNEEMRRNVETLQKQIASEAFAASEAALKKHGRSANYVERSGHAANEIVEWTEKNHVDLLVVGARGAGFVSRLLLGSTSDTVVCHSKSSVLVVRPAKHPDNVEHSPHVTVAWDGSDEAKAALEYLKSWKLVPDARISILTVLPRPRVLPEDIVYDPKHLQEQKSQLDAVCSEFRKHYHNVEVHVVESTSAASTIVGFADRHSSSLVVIGDKGRSAIQRILIGSVARHILHTATCSVLMVKKAK